jgi:hypothetical protein
MRQPVLPPQGAQYAMLPAIEAKLFQQFVRSGVLEPTDLGEQEAEGFWL